MTNGTPILLQSLQAAGKRKSSNSSHVEQIPRKHTRSLAYAETHPRLPIQAAIPSCLNRKHWSRRPVISVEIRTISGIQPNVSGCSGGVFCVGLGLPLLGLEPFEHPFLRGCERGSLSGSAADAPVAG